MHRDLKPQNLMLDHRWNLKMVRKTPFFLGGAEIFIRFLTLFCAFSRSILEMQKSKMITILMTRWQNWRDKARKNRKVLQAM